MLFAGITLVITGFLTLYDFVFWKSRDDLWMIISGAGCLLILANIILRVLRKKLVIELLSINGDFISIHLPSNIQFSSWVPSQQYKVNKSELKCINIFDFRRTTSAGPAGMFMVRFDFYSGKSIESSIDDTTIIKNIIDFVECNMPDIPLHMDERVKSNKSLNNG